MKTAKPVLAKFLGTCKVCGKSIAIGSPVLPHPTLTNAKTGKSSFVHAGCVSADPVAVAVDVVQKESTIQTTTPLPPMQPMQVSVAPRMTMADFKKMFDQCLEETDLNIDVSEEIDPLEAKLVQVEKTLQEQMARLVTTRQTGTFKIDVKVGKLPTYTLKETPNKAFERVLRLAANRKNILLVGPTGSGKTHLAETVAKVLKLPFAFVSCSAGMSEGHLNGRLIPIGKQGTFEYIISEFVKAYENGGVFLLDEIDAADSNTLLVINSAIANGFMSVPNRHKKPIAKRHKDFVIIAAANTFGRGSDRMYVGRNQLDEASLDRFRYGQVEVNYDENVEASLCPDFELRSKLTTIRERVMAHKMRRVVSTRFMKDAYEMSLAGDTWEDCFNALTFGWSTDEIAKVK
jgi:energy-coupling factor transporter ATP-binding protein EcfA2